MMTTWVCEQGIHGDNKRQHLAGRSHSEIKAESGQLFGYRGVCDGLVIRVDGTSEVCSCECHS